jgi:uncharacterized membrane protein YqhA
MNADHMIARKLAWLVGIHMAFVSFGVLLALMDRGAPNCAAARLSAAR